MGRTAIIPTPYTLVSFDSTVDCTVGCTVDCTKGCSADCSLLCNVSPFLFFVSAASLWPWVTRPGCFSHVIIFLSSSVIFI